MNHSCHGLATFCTEGLRFCLSTGISISVDGTGCASGSSQKSAGSGIGPFEQQNIHRGVAAGILRDADIAVLSRVCSHVMATTPPSGQEALPPMCVQVLMMP